MSTFQGHSRIPDTTLAWRKEIVDSVGEPTLISSRGYSFFACDTAVACGSSSAMYVAYIGLLAANGLRFYCREGNQSVDPMIQQLRAAERLRSCYVWFVMNDECEPVILGLLHAGEREAAWMFIQDVARDFGVCDFDAEQRTGQVNE